MPRGVYDRKPKPADDEPETKQDEKVPEICRDCWPSGWPEGGVYSAGCEHGTWYYADRAPKAEL